MPDLQDLVKAFDPNASPDDPWKRTARMVLRVLAIILLLIACILAVALAWKLGWIMVSWLSEELQMLLRM